MTNNDFAKGNNLFTSDIYKEYGKKNPGNFVISPFSAEIILALAESGAKDATAEEIKKVLHLPKTDPEIKKVIDEYFKSLKLGLDHFKLHTANKIYIKQQLVFKDHFQHAVTTVFRGEIERVNFAQGAEAAATMNQWVERQTDNKITNLIDPGVITVDTVAVLVNALYFQGPWLKVFRPELTKKADFFANGKDKVQVDTMVTKERLFCCESAPLKATFLKLKFKGEDASLVVVLPNAKDGLAALEGQAQVFSKQEYKEFEVNLSLPKFKIETSIKLNETLKTMGIKKLFTSEADLSGIAGAKGELFVDQVAQKAFISVDEKGVEAAAATTITIGTKMLPLPLPPKDFIADHPFVFFIEINGVVLMAGRVSDPSK